MTREFLYNFISQNKYAALSTVNEKSEANAALVGFAITPDLKIIFDTVTTSRKYQNLMLNRSIAFVIGWENEQTVQYEGAAKVLPLHESDELLEVYFNVFPDGRERKNTWKDIVHFCVEPKWIRYSDFNTPQLIAEMKF